MEPRRVLASLALDLDRGVLDFVAIVKHRCDGRANNLEVRSFGELDMRRQAVIFAGQGPDMEVVDPGNSRRELLLKLKKKDIELIGGM